MAHINDPPGLGHQWSRQFAENASVNAYSCHCGRAFTQPAALKNHQNSCKTNKSHLLAALKKAKEAYAAEKLQKAATQALVSQLGQTEHHDSNLDALNAQQASIV